MMRIFLMAALAVAGAFAMEVNDLAPDFDNTILDDGFWDTTGHQNVVVAIGCSDAAHGALDSVTCGIGVGAIVSVFDSREATRDESDDMVAFTSKPVGLNIIFR